MPDRDPGAVAPRVGIGFDAHRFAHPPRPLLLGGVRIDDGTPGLDGHSDGDAVCHAIADALLGAMALGDVGERFPDTDPAFAGIAGTELLVRTVGVLADAGGRPSSCDVTVIADAPSIGPHRAAMRDAIAGALGLPADRVSVKATRPEGVGLRGDGVGCLAIAVVV